MEKLHLRKFGDDDLDLFETWVHEDYVAKWYEHPLSWIEELQKREGEYCWIHHFIAVYGGIDFGFCQFYEYGKSGEEWHGSIEVKGTYSIDYMIGKREFLGRGLGKAIAEELIALIRREPGAERIIVQPEPDNAPSCGTLLAAGFEFDGENQLYLYQLA